MVRSASALVGQTKHTGYIGKVSLFPLEEAFRERIIQLKQSSDKQRDPMTCLPPELITHVFGYVPEQRMVSRRVSRIWCNTLDQLPVWRHIKITKDGSEFLTGIMPDSPLIDFTDPLAREGPKLNSQTQQLTWSTYFPPEYVVNILAERGCSQLRSLNLILKNGPLRKVFAELSLPPAHTLMAPFLTDLTLKVNEQHCCLILRLLALLPQLVSLQYKQRRHKGLAAESPLLSGASFPTGPHRLRRLQCLGQSFSRKELACLPPLLPDLESLIVEQVVNMETSEILIAFTKQCQKLQTIVWADHVGPLLDTLSPKSYQLNSATAIKSTTSHGPRGSNYFLLDGVFPLSADMHHFFPRNQHTLELLQFVGKMDTRPLIQNHGFRQLFFPQLRYLSLRSSFFPVADSLPHILSLCPNLEELSISDIELFVDADPQAIAGLPKLHTLRIDGCFYDSGFLEELFDLIVALDRPLATLTILDHFVGDQWITELMLRRLGDIATLRKLVLDTMFHETWDGHIDAFLRHAQLSGLAKNLQYLDIFSHMIAAKPLWLVLLHSVFTAAHITPGFRFDKGVVAL
ncbi:hypothetical protein BCR43DRAFT_493794 [Syncephalastrum racemosum]|uniref:Uncharacterized protein n=1 Tax=Syncephalastrum racemosum TaxID=13706 RepID=A0A1X2HB94_SYNRA|nr:hypothetical protein BCR43DRAFT_493794 [Syncephalastrum racemosum]